MNFGYSFVLLLFLPKFTPLFQTGVIMTYKITDDKTITEDELKLITNWKSANISDESLAHKLGITKKQLDKAIHHRRAIKNAYHEGRMIAEVQVKLALVEMIQNPKHKNHFSAVAKFLQNYGVILESYRGDVKEKEKPADMTSNKMVFKEIPPAKNVVSFDKK